MKYVKGGLVKIILYNVENAKLIFVKCVCMKLWQDATDVWWDIVIIAMILYKTINVLNAQYKQILTNLINIL